MQYFPHQLADEHQVLGASMFIGVMYEYSYKHTSV